MIIERILSRSAGIFSQIYHHPFNQQLYKGTLPREQFITFLKQDAEYLCGFSNALKQLSNRFDDRQLAQQFKWFSENMIESERKLQSRYLSNSPRPTFFSKQPSKTPQMPVIVNYTAYQLHMAQHAPIEEAISCLASCYWIYQKMGEKMNLVNHDTNPYQSWIKSYSSKQFTTATQLMIEALDNMGSPIACHLSQEKIIRSFYQSAQYELLFYDAILPRPNAMDLKIKEPPVLIKGSLR